MPVKDANQTSHVLPLQTLILMWTFSSWTIVRQSNPTHPSYTGAPTIIRIGDSATSAQQQIPLNQQTVQTWNAQQPQQQPNVLQHSVQSQPTPLISANSQPMQSAQMPYMPPGMQQQQMQPPQAQVLSQQSPQQGHTFVQPAQTMQDLRQHAPTFQ
eukprot:4645910-Amphidinium_carterae.1